MPHYALQTALDNAASRIPYRSTSKDVLGICGAWLDDIDTMAADLGPGRAGYVLVHLDKTKWYGPGNVKWLPKGMVSRYRKDSIRWREYYATAPVVYGTPIPKRGYYKGVSAKAKELKTTPYYVRKALLASDDLSSVTVKKGRRGPVATLYEGKSLKEWAAIAGVSVYMLRKHMANGRPMAMAVQDARDEVQQTIYAPRRGRNPK